MYHNRVSDDVGPPVSEESMTTTIEALTAEIHSKNRELRVMKIRCDAATEVNTQLSMKHSELQTILGETKSRQTKLNAGFAEVKTKLDQSDAIISDLTNRLDTTSEELFDTATNLDRSRQRNARLVERNSHLNSRASKFELIHKRAMAALEAAVAANPSYNMTSPIGQVIENQFVALSLRPNDDFTLTSFKGEVTAQEEARKAREAALKAEAELEAAVNVTLCKICYARKWDSRLSCGHTICLICYSTLDRKEYHEPLMLLVDTRSATQTVIGGPIASSYGEYPVIAGDGISTTMTQLPKCPDCRARVTAAPLFF